MVADCDLWQGSTLMAWVIIGSRIIRIVGFGVLGAVALGLPGPVALGQTASPPPSNVLRVGVNQIRPFVFLTPGESPYGYSVDVWRSLERELDIQAELVPFDAVAPMLEAVRQGEIDAAIAGISITASREAENLDFSYPIYRAGLQLLVTRQQSSGLAQLLHYLGGWQAFKALLRVALSSVVVGFLIWWFERKHNPAFQQGLVQGVGQGVWFALATLGTFGYGDVTPLKLPGRLVTVIWMGVSFFVLADFIASMTAARQLYLPVQDIEDLHGVQVGAVADTTAMGFARRYPVQEESYEDLDGAIVALRRGEVKALLLDQPTARYFAARSSDLLLAGDRLNWEDYGIVVREGNTELLESLNRGLLRLQEDDVFRQLDRRWFGQSDASRVVQSDRPG